jgi:hypothetical protein
MSHNLRTRLLRILALQALLLVALTPAAQATPALTPPPPPDARCATSPHGTVCHFDGTFFREIPELVACDSIVVDAVSNSTTSFHRVYDATGAMISEKRHIRFAGTLTNRTTGEEMVYTGSFIVTLDFVAGTVTITGGQGRLLLPDGGVDVVLAGRVVTDLTQDPPVDIFLAGPKDFDAAVCAALA